MAANSKTPKDPKPTPATPHRRRARTKTGEFKGDTAPGNNQAWEPEEVETALTKTIDYSVKPKVTGAGKSTAGKYAKQGKLRPTFGSVTTTFH